MPRFKDLPLIIKLYLCIAVLIIVPILAMGLYLNSQFAALTLNKSSEIAFQTLMQTKQNFETLFVDTNDISTRILSNGLVQDFSKGQHKGLDYDKIYLNMNAWLDDVVGSKTYYRTISLHSGHEAIFQKGMPAPELDSAVMERARQEQGKGFWLTGPGEIAYYRGIMDFGKLGNMIAVERLDINEEVLYGYYKNINAYAGAQTFLMDADGLILSSTERSRIGKKIDHSHFVRDNLFMKDGHFTAVIDHARYIVLYYTIEETHWTLAQVIPEKSFTLLKSTINTVLLIVVALCLIFGSLFSVVLHKYMIRPLLQLRQEMMKLKTGNFNIALNTDSKDEIGEISSGFLRMAQQLKETIHDVYVTKIKQREAEIKALESQINPHFLYNTLDSIHWLAIRHKNYDVSEQIEALAQIFRHVLNKGEPFVTIGQEVDFLENYMFIQKRKYGERIKLHIDAPPDLMKYKMPKLVLQPLVENALLHGLEQAVEGGMIEVRVSQVEEGIRFTVKDNGLGTDETKIRQMMHNSEEAKHVFALKNINDRIRTSYGHPYGLSFASKVGVGTKVEVLIPLIQEGKAGEPG